MPKTATNILENDLFDIPRFYERCSVMPKTATNILTFSTFRNFTRKCSVMPKSVTKVLETARFTAKEALF